MPSQVWWVYIVTLGKAPTTPLVLCVSFIHGQRSKQSAALYYQSIAHAHATELAAGRNDRSWVSWHSAYAVPLDGCWHHETWFSFVSVWWLGPTNSVSPGGQSQDNTAARMSHSPMAAQGKRWTSCWKQRTRNFSVSPLIGFNIRLRRFPLKWFMSCLVTRIKQKS